MSNWEDPNWQASALAEYGFTGSPEYWDQHQAFLRQGERMLCDIVDDLESQLEDHHSEDLWAEYRRMHNTLARIQWVIFNQQPPEPEPTVTLPDGLSDDLVTALRTAIDSGQIASDGDGMIAWADDIGLHVRVEQLAAVSGLSAKGINAELNRLDTTRKQHSYSSGRRHLVTTVKLQENGS